MQKNVFDITFLRHNLFTHLKKFLLIFWKDTYIPSVSEGPVLVKSMLTSITNRS